MSSPAAKFAPAPERAAGSLEDCDFYHTVDIPGHGTVHGQWDLRNHEAEYLGGVDFKDRSVLEIGPASGHLTFWMERRGAAVTAYDLGQHDPWDLVPHHSMDMAAFAASRDVHMNRLRQSWWFLRAALGAKARMVYGTVYDIEPALGRFDVVTLNSVLLHLRDPLRALEVAASVCGQTLVVADIAEEQFYGPLSRAVLKRRSELAMSFIPRAAAPGAADAWFFLPSTLVAEMMAILGFKTRITKHAQHYKDGPRKLYTVVGERIRT